MKTVREAVLYESERRAMVETQLRRRGLSDERVLAAMLKVPRHEFVPPELAHAAYDDRPLPIGEAETISQPYIVAAMTAAARVGPGDKVLEVGTGCGYQAALLAELGGRVYSIERNPQLAEEARERMARLGYSTAASPSVPAPLLDQLADGGRLIIPVGSRDNQFLEQIFKHGRETHTRLLDACRFVPLIGKHGWPEEQ